MAKIKLTKGELKKQRDGLGQFQRYLPALQLKKQQLQMEILHQLNFLEEKLNQEKAKLRSVYGWAGLLGAKESIERTENRQKVIAEGDFLGAKESIERTENRQKVIAEGDFLGAKESIKRTENRQKVIAEGDFLADQEIDLSLALKIKQVLSEARNIAGIDFPVFKSVEFEDYEYDLFLAPLWVDSAIEALKVIIALRKEREVIGNAVDILRSELRIVAQRVNLFEKVKIPEAKENIRMIKIYLGDQLANAVGRSKIAKRKIEGLVLEEAVA